MDDPESLIGITYLTRFHRKISNKKWMTATMIVVQTNDAAGSGLSRICLSCCRRNFSENLGIWKFSKTRCLFSVSVDGWLSGKGTWYQMRSGTSSTSPSERTTKRIRWSGLEFFIVDFHIQPKNESKLNSPSTSGSGSSFSSLRTGSSSFCSACSSVCSLTSSAFVPSLTSSLVSLLALSFFFFFFFSFSSAFFFSSAFKLILRNVLLVIWWFYVNLRDYKIMSLMLPNLLKCEGFDFWLFGFNIFLYRFKSKETDFYVNPIFMFFMSINLQNSIVLEYFLWNIFLIMRKIDYF